MGNSEHTSSLMGVTREETDLEKVSAIPKFNQPVKVNSWSHSGVWVINDRATLTLGQGLN